MTLDKQQIIEALSGMTESDFAEIVDQAGQDNLAARKEKATEALRKSLRGTVIGRNA